MGLYGCSVSVVAEQSRGLTRGLAVAVAALALLAAAIAGGGEGAGAAGGVAELGKKRERLLVGNNWAGTVDIVGQRSFKRLHRLDITPDFEERMASLSPQEQLVIFANREFAGEGNDQQVDDIRVSPDGRTLYASRPSFNDVVALDIATEQIIWRYSVSEGYPNHYRSDHMTISPDGKHLAVSVTIGNVVDILDAKTGERVGGFPTGDFAHENEYSADGEHIYNGSIGRVITPDFDLATAAKGTPLFTIADADTFEVEKTFEFDRGVRPFQVMPSGNKLYLQLSFFPGFKEYSLVKDRLLRTKRLPLRSARDLPKSEYPLDSAHHGLAMSGDRKRLCDAATISDYVAIVKRRTLKTEGIVKVGDKPYWATTSGNGRLCFVANSESDDISVINYRKAEEIARFDVGDHPQRLRIAPVRVPVG